MVKVLKLGCQKKYRFTRRIRRFFLTLLPFTLELKGRQCTLYSIVPLTTVQYTVQYSDLPEHFFAEKGLELLCCGLWNWFLTPILTTYTVNFCCPKNAGAKLFGQIYWKQNVCDNFVDLVCLNIAKKLFFIQFYAESEPARRVQDIKFVFCLNRMGRFV